MAERGRSRTEDDKAGLLAWLQRFADGLLPAADGGPPPALKYARSQFSWITWSAVGLLAGSVVGFLLVLLIGGMPQIPVAVLAFGGGAMVGAALTLLIASRIPLLRGAGAAAILVLPLVVILLPFLLLGGAIALLRRFPARTASDAGATAGGAVALPEGTRRRAKGGPRKS